MRITYYPAYDITSASSRLRVYWIQQELLKKGIEAKLQSSPFKSDIVVFQKIFIPYCIDLANKLKKKNIKVLFDLDDNFPRARPMIEIADVVTGDTESQINWIKNLVKRDVTSYVVKDTIDYLKEPIPRRIHKKKSNLKLVYFGGIANLDCMDTCKSALINLQRDTGKFKFYYICGERDDSHFEGLDFEYIKWNYKTFSDTLREFDIVILPQIDDSKSRTKLTQSIAHNVPVIGSPIPSYWELAKSTNVKEYFPNTEEEWYQATKKLFNPSYRNKYLDKTIDWVWKHHNIKLITDKWIKVFEEALEL